MGFGNMKKGTNSNYIPSLNGLRAISIIMVIWAHVNGWSLHRQGINCLGLLGVHIFFVISGFLITTLLIEEEKVNGEISIKKFFERRILRIFPAFYFLLIVYFILQLSGVIYIHPVSWLTSITYTKYFPLPHASDKYTGHLWSLSVEEHFYLFWPLIFKFSKKYRVKLAWAIVIITPLFRILYSINGNPLFTSYGFFQSADALMIGCLVAYYKSDLLIFLKSIFSYAKILIYLPFLLLILLVIADEINFPFFVIGGIPGQLPRLFYILHFDMFVPFGILGTLGSVSIGLIILISSNFLGSYWFAFLNTSVMNYIGTLSYSLYLWQQIFFAEELNNFSKFPYNIVFVFIAAIISFYMIESPFLRLKTKLKAVK
jgi:peptidoglycan/LPS O-acetylase OafA/YrhL